MDNGKTAVLVLSYCLYKDGTRLSIMAQKSAELGVVAICKGEAQNIIFSTAYSCWKKEAEMKKEVAIKNSVSPEKIHFIEGVRHTFDEIKGVKKILNLLGVKKLIVVVEKYHIPRVRRMLKKNFPEIQFEFRIFKTKYERTLEPCKNPVRFLKEHRGSLFTWWLWNTACNLVW